jgi:lipoprotein-anchoring transpeptidase ErfK/SrfK
MNHCLLFLVALLLAGPDRWLEVDLESGRLYAHEGEAVVREAVVTLGTARHPVPAGKFRIESKERRYNGKVGPDAFIVPWLLNLDGEGSIHGRYWKRRMGQVMMHGAITLRHDDAEWLYNWVEVGTPVVVHD